MPVRYFQRLQHTETSHASKATVDQIMRQAADLFAQAQLDLQAMQGSKVVRSLVPNTAQRTPPFKSPQQGRKAWWRCVIQP